MTSKGMLREIEALPFEAKRNLQDFIVFLRERYENSLTPPPAPLNDLTKAKFVGMCRDREDMRDNSAWVRQVRSTYWGL